MRRKHRQIAPRLANGDSREVNVHRLPGYVKEGLKGIAKMENKSLSWVLEEVVIRYFHLRRPVYKRKKNPNRVLKLVRAR